MTEYDTPNLKETASIESKLEDAEHLIKQLTALVDDIRGQTRKFQQDLDVNS